MEFLHPWLFITAIPFIILFFLMKNLEKKKYRNIPTAMIVKKIKGLKLAAKKCGRILWIFSAIFLVITLTRPQSSGETENLGIEGRMMILSIDLSMSMSGTNYSKTGRSSVDVIQELSLEFVKKRATTDLVGITAYGGRGFGREKGEAAVIVFPTSEYSQLEMSVKIIKPQILGIYTSIGEGIFISILSLVDPGVIREIKKENPNYFDDLMKSIEKEDKTYALNFIRKLGRFRNKIVILFTDGKNNAGIEPKYPLWLCKMLGIKVYFAALESTGSTGLSPIEEARQKSMLIDGVMQTGGKYYEMGIVENVKNFYEDVDKLETARLEIKTFKNKKDFYFWPVLISLAFASIGIILEIVFPRIQ